MTEPWLMDRRRFLLSAAGAMGALVLPACRKAGTYAGGAVDLVPRTTQPSLAAGELPPLARFGLRMPGGDFGFPNPFNYFPPGYGRVSYVFDSLLWIDSTRGLVPWLAREWQRSPDGLVYSFTLRDGVRWHDGKPLTADDVAFSFEYFKAKKATDKIRGFILFPPEHVAAVKTTGATGVQITLDKPVVTFSRGLAARFPIAPRHIWSSIDDPSTMTDVEKLVGTGPYRLKSYRSDPGAYLYTANDDFFLGQPVVDRIELRPVRNELDGLRTGELDAGGFGTTGVTREALAPFKNNPAFQLLEGPLEFPSVLVWNTGKGGALGDVAFRRACAHAIDRKDIIDRLLSGNGAPGNPGFLPPDHLYHVDVEQYAFNRAMANRILDEAGYRRGANGVRQGKDGTPLRFKLLAIPDLAPVVELVTQALRAVGIELRLEPTDTGGAFQSIAKANFEMAIIFYGGVSEDPDILRTVYSSRVERSFLSAPGYANAEVDDLAERQLVAQDEAERKSLIAQIQKIVASDIPVLHLYYPRIFSVVRTKVWDQWPFEYYNKQALVTGTRSGGLDIRPTRPGA